MRNELLVIKKRAAFIVSVWRMICRIFIAAVALLVRRVRNSYIFILTLLASAGASILFCTLMFAIINPAALLTVAFVRVAVNAALWSIAFSTIYIAAYEIGVAYATRKVRFN